MRQRERERQGDVAHGDMCEEMSLLDIVVWQRYTFLGHQARVKIASPKNLN